MPECIHGQRILDGVFAQCHKYGYDAAVFATMTNLLHNDRIYENGEETIYQLPDFALFDGVIVDAVAFCSEQTQEVRDKILNRLHRDCRVPVVALEVPFGACHVIENDNENILREMCRHLAKLHGKRDICILTGAKENPVAEYRLSVFLDELEKLGIKVPEHRIIYGDFWYTSGEKLADDIAAGRKTMPEAFLCASDHMALGLIERLKIHGFSIPRDTIVIGFEATKEAALNLTPLTSFAPNDTKTAADAVDYLRSQAEPDAVLLPYPESAKVQCCAGESCGCQPDYLHSLTGFREALYYTMRNYNMEMRQDDIDIGLLMENYVSEKFTGAKTPQDCLLEIWVSTYLLHPFVHHFLCLADNWLTDYTPGEERYPEKMRLISVHSNQNEPTFCGGDRSVLFDTADMLPYMLENTDPPSVFYFSPVHFGDKTFGYSVLQRELTEPKRISLVYRNWLRLVNNSLEMMRSKNRYMVLSTHDEMTGLLNRRGFFAGLQQKLSETDAAGGYALVMLSVDLDGLKKINDTYGHLEGDYAISTVSRALRRAAGPDAVCGRFGGDEFVAAILLSAEQVNAWYTAFLQSFREKLDACNLDSGKPYQIRASIGFAVQTYEEGLNPDTLINQADERMYADKIARKAART